MAKVKVPNPQELAKVNYRPPAKGWMDVKPDFRPGTYVNAAQPKWLEMVNYPYPRAWSVKDEDWKLPENWKEIILQQIGRPLKPFPHPETVLRHLRALRGLRRQVPFFIGHRRPQKHAGHAGGAYTLGLQTLLHQPAGKILGALAGARDLTEDVLKEWFYYLHQCTICRRCSVFCPYGIDMAEMTILGRELLASVGINIDWAMASVASCYTEGNHIGATPQAFKDMLDFLAEENERITGIETPVTYNRKGAEILFITPSGDYFADPGSYTMMGYLLLFKYLDLDYTVSTYAAEGGNFGWFISHEMGKRLNIKMYEEAKRLGVKWILGGECGHMWRVCNQYQNTYYGESPSFLEVPKSPVTGTVFDNASVHKMVHISEFTADLIHNNKLKFDVSRNEHIKLTFHDSCNPARAMGIFRRTPLHHQECPARGSLLRDAAQHHPGEDLLLRQQRRPERRRVHGNQDEGRVPRANAVRHVADKYGVNHLGCICALDRATLPPLMQYWVPEMEVTGITELVGNALVFPDEIERTTDLREPAPGGFRGSGGGGGSGING